MDWIQQFIEKLFPEKKEDLDIEGAFRLKYQHLPKEIYKYRVVDECSLKNLEEDTIWLSNPCKFNDPYDSAYYQDPNELENIYLLNNLDRALERHGLKEKVDGNKIKEILNIANPMEGLAKYIISLDPKIPAEYKDEISSSLISAYKKMNEDLFKVYSEDFKNSFKVCAFSERIDSLLMWAHYANCHKGFCIEYDITKFQYEDYRSRFLYPVIYSDELFTVKPLHNKKFNILYLTLAALIKARDWAYEKEWRLVFSQGILAKEQTFYMGIPKAIYLGSKISEKYQSMICEIALKKGVDVFKMKLVPGKFRLEPASIKEADQFFFRKK